jgi:hypothetical protein
MCITWSDPRLFALTLASILVYPLAVANRRQQIHRAPALFAEVPLASLCATSSTVILTDLATRRRLRQ